MFLKKSYSISNFIQKQIFCFEIKKNNYLVLHHIDLTLKLHISMHSVWNGKLSFVHSQLFSLIGRIIQKIIIEASAGILIVSNWHTQRWYSHLTKILIIRQFYHLLEKTY